MEDKGMDIIKYIGNEKVLTSIIAERDAMIERLAMQISQMQQIIASMEHHREGAKCPEKPSPTPCL